MLSNPPSHSKPRKRPHQAHATATLDITFEAAIQVLLVDGRNRLTLYRSVVELDTETLIQQFDARMDAALPFNTAMQNDNYVDVWRLLNFAPNSERRLCLGSLELSCEPSTKRTRLSAPRHISRREPAIFGVVHVTEVAAKNA